MPRAPGHSNLLVYVLAKVSQISIAPSLSSRATGARAVLLPQTHSRYTAQCKTVQNKGRDSRVSIITISVCPVASVTASEYHFWIQVRAVLARECEYGRAPDHFVAAKALARLPTGLVVMSSCDKPLRLS